MVGEPVISSHLENNGRFRTPQILVDHGIRRAINVPIYTRGRRYGVLEVDSPIEGRFTGADIAFMQGFANLPGFLTFYSGYTLAGTSLGSS